MTKEELEKEAEEYTNFVKSTKKRWNSHEIFYSDIELAYQKGAEFGYNKAKKWLKKRKAELDRPSKSYHQPRPAHCSSFGSDS